MHACDDAIPASPVCPATVTAVSQRTPEAIVDAADIAYRRRFLLQKYPHLADEEAPVSFPDAGPDGPDEADEAISVLDQIAEAGGPDLH